MTSGNWKPLFFALSFLFIVSGTLYLVITSFQSVDDIPHPTGVMGGVYDFVNTGFNITIPVPILPDLTFNFNVFDHGPGASETKAFTLQQILISSLIPLFLLIPLAILFVLGITYGVIKLFLP